MTENTDPTLVQRFQRVLDELHGIAGVEVTSAVIRPSQRRANGEPLEREDDSARKVGLLLDEDLCRTWNSVEKVEIRWQVAERLYGDLIIPDWFELEEAFVLPENAGATTTDPDFLSELHLLECDDAEHWTAFRTPGWAQERVTAVRMELWTRIPSHNSNRPLDLRLAVSWDDYVERMLLTRGAWRWQLTCAEDHQIPQSERSTVAAELKRFLEASALFSDPGLAVLRDATKTRMLRLRG